ncbi:MAG: lipid A biosynthesis acyltransferase [Hydrogenothermaceae bacterium]
MLLNLIKIVFFLLRKVDRKTALKLSKVIGFTLYITNYRKSVVEKNLQIAFPDKDQKWRDYIRKKCMENIGRVLVEFPKQPDYVKSGNIKNIVIFEKGLEEIKKEKNGAIITTAHLSNWEMAGAGLASYIPGLVSLAYRQNNKDINQLITQIRNDSGIDIIFHDQPLKKMVQILQEGKFLGILVDQNALKHRGYFVDFFGLKASTVNLPAKLAVKFKKPIYFLYIYFDEKKQVYFLNVEKLSYPEGKTEEETTYNIVKAYTKAVEEAVKKHPDQYLWVHKRWKTREDEEVEKIYD